MRGQARSRDKPGHLAGVVQRPAYWCVDKLDTYTAPIGDEFLKAETRIGGISGEVVSKSRRRTGFFGANIPIQSRARNRAPSAAEAHSPKPQLRSTPARPASVGTIWVHWRMCNRYHPTRAEIIQAQWELGVPTTGDGTWRPGIGPWGTGPFIRTRTRESEPELVVGTWALIGDADKKPINRPRMTNCARSEELLQKKTYRGPWSRGP